jgi:hypothetical protein
MTEDETLVQDQVSFPGGGYHFETNAFAANDRTQAAFLEILVGTWKRLGFLNLHLEVATLERARAGLVAEHLGAAFFAHVTLTEHVSHLMVS